MLLDSGLLTLTSSQDNVSAIALNSSRGGITLSTSNASGNGNLSLLSAGTLTLDTSSKNSNLRLQTGSGTLSASLGTVTISTETGPFSLISRSSPFSLITESTTNGPMYLSSTGTLTLDTSRTGASVFLQGGLVRVGLAGTVDNISGSGSLYVQNNLEVDGNVYLGTSTANSLSVSGYVTSNLVPNPGSQYDLGSNTRRWSNLYADTVTASNIAGTVITGSTSAANWTIDVSNATADLEDSTVTFERGTEVVNAELRWNSSGDRYFSTNASFQVSPDTGIGIPFRPEQAIMVVNDSYGGRRLLTLREAGSDVLNVDSSGNILLSQAANIETSSGALTVRGYSGLTLTTSSVTTGEIRVLSRGTLQLDTSANNNNILLKTGSGNINVSTGTLTMTGVLDVRDSTGTLALATDTNGNVGVGTTSPTGILDILGQCVARGTRIRLRRRRRKSRLSSSRAKSRYPAGGDQDISIASLDSSTRAKALAQNDGVGDDWEELELPIEEIKEGDEILTLDEKTGKFVWQTVEATMNKGIQVVIELATEDGKKIETTAEHPYLVRQTFGGVEFNRDENQGNGNQQQRGRNLGRSHDVPEILSIHFDHRSNLYASNINTIPATRDFVKVSKFSGSNSNSNPGDINTNPNQPADKLPQIPETTRNKEILSLLASEKFIPLNLSGSCQSVKWLKVNNLKVGMEIATVNGWQKIISIKLVGRKQTYDLQIEGTHNFVGNGIVAHNTTGILMRAGASSLQLSSSATSTTADIELAAADRIDLFAGSLSLQTSSQTAGELKLMSKGSLILDTSGAAGGGAPIALQAGSGNINLSSTGTITLTGNTSLNNGTLRLNGLTYTFPGADSANGVLLSNGSGVLSWTTIGASSITADSLDFSEFKDEMTLDADTSINGDQSLILRIGRGALQDSTGGNNDLQLAAEDKLILAGASFDLSTSSGAVDIISNQRLDLSAGGTLTLDTSSNNSNILLKTGSGNINVSTGTLTMTGVLDIRDSTGTLGLAVDSTGNVGIGTTGPLQRFQVNDTATAAFVVTSAGQVGIGTTSPTGILDILGQCVTGDTVLKRRRRRKGRTLKGGAAGDGPEPKRRGRSDLYSFDDFEDVRIDEIEEGHKFRTS